MKETLQQPTTTTILDHRSAYKHCTRADWKHLTEEPSIVPNYNNVWASYAAAGIVAKHNNLLGWHDPGRQLVLSIAATFDFDIDFYEQTPITRVCGWGPQQQQTATYWEESQEWIGNYRRGC